MTNPGHIDPLFTGHISVYLVNMGKSSVRLKKGSKVATLLLYYVKGDVGAGNISGGGVTKEQVLTLSKDFANLDTRMPNLLNSVIRDKALLWGGVVISMVALAFTLIPLLSEQVFTNKAIDVFKLEHVEPLKSINNQQQIEIVNLKADLAEKNNQLENLRLRIDEKDFQIKSLTSDVKKLFYTLDNELTPRLSQKKELKKIEN